MVFFLLIFNNELQFLLVFHTQYFFTIFNILFLCPGGKRMLGRPRHRWEDNIKVDLQEVGWGDWTGLSWQRVETGGGDL